MRVTLPKPVPFLLQTLFGLCAVQLAVLSCAALSAKPNEPCPDMYCIQVTVAGVPGAPLVCYKTPIDLLNAKVYWKNAGYQVSDVIVKDK